MFIKIILYIHILAATAWIGGSLFLFLLGVFIHNKEAQIHIYERIGPLYGYSESLWLMILWASGLTLFSHFNLYEVMSTQNSTPLAVAMTQKLYVVVLITIATAIHMFISLATPLISRTPMQKILSRASSLMILLLNLLILWFAISLRTILY